MGLGSFLSNAVEAVGSIGIGPVTVGNVVGVASDAVKKVTDTVAHIPVLGSVVGVTTPIHLVEAANDVVRGARIDKAALGVLKNEVKDYKAVAPYAASIVAIVPGIGPGIGAGIAAGAALADGKPWSDVAIEAAKGAIPGGAIAQAAFSASVAAARGQRVDQIAIAALPIPDQAKQAATTALAITKDLADGKRVDAALLAHADEILKTASPAIAKALQLGSAIGVARNIQDEVMRQVRNPQALAVLQNLGADIIKRTPALQAGQSLGSEVYKQGYDLAVGIMNGQQATETLLTGLRNAVTGEARKGFDAAVAYHIGKHVVKGGKLMSKKGIAAQAKAKQKELHPTGMSKGHLATANARQNAKPVGMSKAHIAAAAAKAPAATAAKPPPTPAQSFGYFATQGLQGAGEEQKTVIVGDMAEHPEMRVGATDAIKDIAAERQAAATEKTFWQKVKDFFGF